MTLPYCFLKRYSVNLLTNQFVIIVFMDLFLLLLNYLLLLCSTANALLLNPPRQIAKWFKMEEDLVLILRMATRIHKSEALTLYLETCEPRFKQLPLGEPSKFISRSGLTRLKWNTDLLISNINWGQLIYGAELDHLLSIDQT